MTPSRTVLIVLLLVTQICYCCAQSADEALFANLDGEYKLVDVNKMLNIAEESSSLKEGCPSLMSLAKTAQPTEFGLVIGSEGTSKDECRLSQNASAIMTFKRVTPQISRQAEGVKQRQQTLTLREISAFFPTLLAFSPDLLECPNDIEIFTQIVAQDVGYWYTLLNHYKATGEALGKPFNKTDATNLNALTGMYALSLSLDFDKGLGCTYLKASEESKLTMKVNEVLTPSPTSAGSSKGSNESTCFPADARVELADGSLVAMKDLQIGDVVRDTAGSTSKVLLFTHADSAARSEFVIIHTVTAQLALSPTHYIYTGKELLPAEAVKVGDEVTVVTHDSAVSTDARVVKVEREVMSGLYNPQTASGQIVVWWRGEGVLASTYTKAVAPGTAHALLGPLRFLDMCLDVTIPRLSALFTPGQESKVLLG